MASTGRKFSTKSTGASSPLPPIQVADASQERDQQARAEIVDGSKLESVPVSGNHKQIEIAAYYRAEHRGFEPGHELEDWLAAEQEVRGASNLQ